MSDSPSGALQPVDDDGVRIVAIGTVVWLVAGIVCLAQRSRLVERGTEWWLWTCVVGVGLGVGMLVYMRRRASAYRAHHSARDAAGPRGRAEREPDSG
jgi:hypothetical protein